MSKSHSGPVNLGGESFGAGINPHFLSYEIRIALNGSDFVVGAALVIAEFRTLEEKEKKQTRIHLNGFGLHFLRCCGKEAAFIVSEPESSYCPFKFPQKGSNEKGIDHLVGPKVDRRITWLITSEKTSPTAIAPDIIDAFAAKATAVP